MEVSNAFKPIYTITVLRKINDYKTIGYTYNFDEAEEFIMQYSHRIREDGYYQFAVVERVFPGIYNAPRKDFWFRCNHENEFERYPGKPDRFKQMNGFALI